MMRIHQLDHLSATCSSIRENGYKIKLTEDGTESKTAMFRKILARTERCKNQTGTKAQQTNFLPSKWGRGHVLCKCPCIYGDIMKWLEDVLRFIKVLRWLNGRDCLDRFHCLFFRHFPAFNILMLTLTNELLPRLKLGTDNSNDVNC